MNRRQFLSSSTVTALALGSNFAPADTASPSQSSVHMELGDQTSPTNETHLKYLARYGVHHICAYPEIDGDRLYATVDELKRTTDMAAKYGISVDCIAPPILESSFIDKEKHPAIMLAENPERNRDIEQLQKYIRNCALAGIPSIKYNMSILGVQRIGRTPGRGSATYSTWNYQKASNKDKLTEAGAVSPDAYWERIDYFLSRMVPVAAEYKVRMACHPHDPGMPEPEGYRGVHTVLGSVNGLKKFVAMHENPYHGLNFCQGTVSEMLQDPNREIVDVIHYFGSRKKIFNVHFRNIRGHFSDFVETFPDNGSVNMLNAAKAYYDVGYDYMLMPDHVPVIPGDKSGYQAFAFAFGYIQAAIQMFG